MAAKGYNLLYSKDINQSAYILTHLAYHLSEVKLQPTSTDRFITTLRLPESLNPDFRTELESLLIKYNGSLDKIVGSNEFDPLPTCIKMWQCLVGKSKIVITLCKTYSLRFILRNKDEVDEFRYDNGKLITKRDIIKERIENPETLIGILQCVKGISRKIAEFIYRELGTGLYEMTDSVVLTMDNRKLNCNLLPKFVACLDYKCV